MESSLDRELQEKDKKRRARKAARWRSSEKKFRRQMKKEEGGDRFVIRNKDGSIHLLPPSSSSPSTSYTSSPSPIHGTGLFACTDIPSGTLLGFYHGRVLSISDILREIRNNKPQTYWMWISGEHVIDGSTLENEMRYVNHADNKSPTCNCISDQDSVGRLSIRTKRDVKNGEELLFDYGYDPRTEWK